ncbi:MAG TPA: hypothetical protein VGM41_11045 [Chitinophagaceae bacterium]|jgi:uncharacterized membrane protein
MNNLTKAGRLFFALGIIGLGVLSIIKGDFIVGRPPGWPAGMSGSAFWASFAGTILIITGIAVIGYKKAGVAALATGVLILFYSFIARHLVVMAGSPLEADLWAINAYKTLALSGGAFIVAASFFKENGQNGYKFISNKALILTGTIFISLFFIIGGSAHFKFDQFVFNLIPSYIPFHVFWTYFCGIALIAGGIGLLIKPVRYWAALLSAWMVLGWFVLLHIPRVIAAPNDPSDRMGLFESLAISGVLFVLSVLFSGENSIKRNTVGQPL